MEELCEQICNLFETPNFDRNEFNRLLTELRLLLDSASSRFVDIDPTTLEINFLRGDISTEVDSEALIEIYEALKTYLVVRNKYGEAADWYLKDEYDSYLKEKLISNEMNGV